MADVGIFTKNVDIVARAGANCNATAVTIAETDKYVLQIEAYVNAETRYNWSDAYAGLNVDVKYAVLEATTCLCAMQVIAYDMSGIGLAEAETRLDYLRDAAQRAIKMLMEIKSQTFMIGAA